MSTERLEQARDAARELKRLQQLSLELPQLESEAQAEEMRQRAEIQLELALERVLASAESLCSRREDLHARLAELVREIIEVKDAFISWKRDKDTLYQSVAGACQSVALATSSEKEVKSGRALEKANRLLDSTWPVALRANEWPVNAVQNALLTWMLGTNMGCDLQR